MGRLGTEEAGVRQLMPIFHVLPEFPGSPGPWRLFDHICVLICGMGCGPGSYREELIFFFFEVYFSYSGYGIRCCSCLTNELDALKLHLMML